MSRVIGVLVVFALVPSCDDKKSAALPRAAEGTGNAAPALPAEVSPPLTSATTTGSAPLEPIWTFDCNEATDPKSAKSIGHTSIAFKVELVNGKKAAWKPNAKKVRGRYKGEVAAYRLAQSLGLANVPPACFRAFDGAAAASALAANMEAAELFANEVLLEHGKVRGVVIPWIDGLQFWPLEKEPLRAEARAWLTAGSEIPQAKLELARQTSTLVAFDFVTGNWDRYSGGNVGMDRARSIVLYIDNDAGFMEAPPKDSLARNKKLLDATDRFSRSFVARVRELDDERLATTFGDESPGTPLLSKKVISLVRSRLKELIAVVDAKIAAHGEAETLYFE